MVRRWVSASIGLPQGRGALPALDRDRGRHGPDRAPRHHGGARFRQARRPGASTLVGGLKDAHWLVREQAAASAGKSRLPEATVALIAALDDEAWQVRAKAANALGRLRAEKRDRSTWGGARVRRQQPAQGGRRRPRRDRRAGRPAVARIRDERSRPDVRKLVRWAVGRCQTAA